jgi:hypothetical protein
MLSIKLTLLVSWEVMLKNMPKMQSRKIKGREEIKMVSFGEEELRTPTCI